MQKDIAKRIELLTILILSFSPQLISLHNVLVTEFIVGDSSTLIFFAEIESSKTSHSILSNYLSSGGPSNRLPPLHPISPYLLVPFLPTNLPSFLYYSLVCLLFPPFSSSKPLC